MEIKCAINVLRLQLEQSIEVFGEVHKLSKSLTIAINVMEDHYRISELILEKIEQFPADMGLYTRGLYDGYYNSVNIINSITKQS